MNTKITFTVLTVSSFFFAPCLYAMKPNDGEQVPFITIERKQPIHIHVGSQGSAESQEHSMTLQELIAFGAQRGVVQGTSQLVASLLVEMAQIAIQKGLPYLTTNEKQMQQQEQMVALEQAEKQFQTLLETIRTSGPMVTTLVEGSTQLNDEEAKKMATLALMKYGAQVNMALEMNNLQLQAIMNSGIAS